MSLADGVVAAEGDEVHEVDAGEFAQLVAEGRGVEREAAHEVLLEDAVALPHHAAARRCRVVRARAGVEAGADGLEVTRRIVAGAARWLSPSGLLALEVGETQAEEVRSLLTGLDAWVEPDLTGRDRFVFARPRPLS